MTEKPDCPYFYGRKCPDTCTEHDLNGDIVEIERLIQLFSDKMADDLDHYLEQLGLDNLSQSDRRMVRGKILNLGSPDVDDEPEISSDCFYI
ncbi:hypothetical protein COW99_03235 [Candidatus Roizmanbacteria bacterium CG22_combo_CG10-13_8_21_14_all_38_20]|uniref:Uncharacterized protein n=1 Tax=Candidatus Roizmanbacteria bacterium CG22_combo_CG10-13_8_21_14_all_38_20 TaxID=1974862 RepID=A0A2H0BVH5_9BACT|nr:MAG: hypothetical protein COW99_03235 [Candidatus Roizmanbacteria bacterium CG22_combo_CG10-13_8_21_14_all_38_20]PJC31552.1 MAG: hypothetical protein CO050_03165 [Candidatus Roizmanbacteria bacterium CG_4_9_14_0_2_um_filter_38_17]